MTNTANVACVLHGDAYDWEYVENLYSMVNANTTKNINFHVLTESSRSVPDHMIKHDLIEWPAIQGSKLAWWYKMQLFMPGQFRNTVTYFDLDTVIVNNIDYLLELDDRYFWAVLDFKHLWRGNWRGINSSIMSWHPRRVDYIWKDFTKHNISVLIKRHHGDQDYLTTVLQQDKLKYINKQVVKSWRWQVFNGGIDTKTRKYKYTDGASRFDPDTQVLIFHGHPKPHDIDDPLIQKHWKMKHK